MLRSPNVNGADPPPTWNHLMEGGDLPPSLHPDVNSEVRHGGYEICCNYCEVPE